MIQGTPPILQQNPWQAILAQSITDPAELLERLALPENLLPAAKQAAKLFGLKVPLPYLSRIKKNTLADPLLRQVLPLGDEMQQVAGYTADPVADLAAMQSPGLLQKYPGRALLLMTGACGIHCRYCFRRHFDYAEANPAKQHWQLALDHLKADERIEEIILSGGDPLSLSDQRLEKFLENIEKINHINTLRIHTRLPVVLPERITPGLCQLLQQTRLNTVMVLHINHAQEMDTNVEAICAQLQQTGTRLLNQSVLLASVNDSAKTLIQLSKKLHNSAILPYYLHQLDPVSGAAHFAVPDAQARDIITAMTAQLPGYLVPKLVREIAGETSKTAL